MPGLFQKRTKFEGSWEKLLKMGIRGATEKEIINHLNSIKKDNEDLILLQPKFIGLRNQGQIWYRIVKTELV